ncbi:MAG: hypothetical protein MUD12_00090 [Spirochaetes bacterium]|jgi:hypothetical protein|nr:hypothetical protein [Spirochaetota bacterium]
MGSLSFEPLKLERVNITVGDNDSGLSIKMSGMIDMRDPTLDILPYLLKIHEEVLKKSLKNIKADFTDLTFMNSSGIKTIISWIMKLNDVPVEKRYKINIIYNPNITWQESSIQVMQQLFPDFIVVETE